MLKIEPAVKSGHANNGNGRTETKSSLRRRCAVALKAFTWRLHHQYALAELLLAGAYRFAARYLIVSSIMHA